MEIPTPKERNLYLDTAVDLESTSKLIKEIHEINETDSYISGVYMLSGCKYIPKPINLYINTYGGDVYSALGLISVIETSKVPVHTIALGAAMSAGVLILISGHKRFAHSYSTLMEHETWGFSIGNLSEIKNEAKELKRLNEICDTLILKKSNISRKELKRKRKVDWFINSEDALIYGMIDYII
jgi:ATP-dependent Clp protease protease subunit